MIQDEGSSRNGDGPDRPGGPESHPPDQPGGPETRPHEDPETHPQEDPGSPREPDPDSSQDIHGTEDATLGGYFRVHNRPPAFEGSDGQPYTVSIEVERTPDLRAPWHGFLVFPRWAETGVGIAGHVETPILWKGSSQEDVIRDAGATPLFRVKELLDEAILRKRELEQD